MKWSDHILLNNLYRVFKKKILPNSTRQASSLFPDIIKDPSEWEELNEKSLRSPDPRSRKKTMKESQTPPSSQKSQTHFVSVISSDEEDNEVEEMSTTDNRKNLVRVDNLSQYVFLIILHM